MKNKVPRYMLPGKIFLLDEFPQNANGKIDRKKLKQMMEENHV